MEILNKTKKICAQSRITPTRSKGQNFLINEAIYNRIIEVAKIQKDDVVLEVGPGLGFLTEKLSDQAEKVLAVELDKKVFNVLKERLIGRKNLEIINEDILDILKAPNPKSQLPNKYKIQNTKFKTTINNTKYQILNTKYKIVANLPYNITSIFLRKVYELENKPDSMVLMLQKEVAERITAGPGKMSKLAVMCQTYAEAEIMFPVSREEFWPSPEVDSVVIRLITRKNSFIETPEIEKSFFRLLRIAFAQKRKMLKNNLANGFHVSQKQAEKWLTEAGFKPNVRAQELGVEDWERLLAQKDIT